MPPLTRWFIKSAFGFLVLALILRLLQTGNSLVQGSPYISALGPVYFHVFMVGWVTQLIFGVVFWMFPKESLDNLRGQERLGYSVFWLLNIGLVLRILAEPLNTLQPDTGWGWLLVASAVLQWMAGMGFVINTWRRVKPR
jgi:uncharacterized membrane protein